MRLSLLLPIIPLASAFSSTPSPDSLLTQPSSCAPSLTTLVTTLANSTQATYTLRVQHTISGFSPEPSRCRTNTTIALPKGYKARHDASGIMLKGSIAVPSGALAQLGTVSSFGSRPESALRGYATLKGPLSGVIMSRVVGSESAAWSSCEGDELGSEFWIEGGATTDGDWSVEMDVDVEAC